MKGLLHIHLDEVDSTNNYLRTFKADEEHRITLVTATNQTSGRGQRGNSWESEPGRNVVFSVLLHPRFVSPMEVFALSEAMALAVCQTVEEYLDENENENDDDNDGDGENENENEVAVKWPNDIYVGEKKICGILIENKLRGSHIEDCIIGVGLNVNQRTFVSDAPNPVSLYNLTGREHCTDEVLQTVMRHFSALYQRLEDGQQASVHEQYMQHLFRRDGMHPYRDERGEFLASIAAVEPSGHLVLKDSEGELHRYAFKEVSFSIEN